MPIIVCLGFIKIIIVQNKVSSINIFTCFASSFIRLANNKFWIESIKSTKFKPEIGFDNRYRRIANHFTRAAFQQHHLVIIGRNQIRSIPNSQRFTLNKSSRTIRQANSKRIQSIDNIICNRQVFLAQKIRNPLLNTNFSYRNSIYNLIVDRRIFQRRACLRVFINRLLIQSSAIFDFNIFGIPVRSNPFDRAQDIANFFAGETKIACSHIFCFNFTDITDFPVLFTSYSRWIAHRNPDFIW